MTYNCVVCGKQIKPERVRRALKRGQEPKYDSTKCQKKYHNEQSYRKKKTPDPQKPPAPRSGWLSLAELEKLKSGT